MAAVTIRTGPIEENDAGTRINVQSVRPPFSKSSYEYTKELVVGTDFTSGDSIIFDLPAVTGVEFACFTTNVGAIITYAETALSAELGKKLTLTGTHTANIKCKIICSV